MKSMVKFTTQTGSYLALILVLAAFAIPAQAHEFRQFGNYVVGIGTEGEPPVAGVAASIEFFALYNNPDGSQVALDRSAGDKVDLAVVPITVATESNSAALVEADEGIFTHFTQTVIEDVTAYRSDVFTPDLDDVGGTGPGTGYLGYYLTAVLKKVGKPSKTLILKKFVCGAGSLDTVGGSLFDCVVAP
ncbi:MAG: hypothetical protein HOO93_05645 [Methyloglobulus sp.]|nr:hypothetical protein [Methyloglobulus sp.]